MFTHAITRAITHAITHALYVSLPAAPTQVARGTSRGHPTTSSHEFHLMDLDPRRKNYFCYNEGKISASQLPGCHRTSVLCECVRRRDGDGILTEAFALDFFYLGGV
jgi:hypothetical protein